MKSVITIQLVRYGEAVTESSPQRKPLFHGEAKRTCAQVTERDRSCVERACRGAIEPRKLYNCGSSPDRTGRKPSCSIVTKATGRAQSLTGGAQTPPGSLDPLMYAQGLSGNTGRAMGPPSRMKAGAREGKRLKETPGVNAGPDAFASKGNRMRKVLRMRVKTKLRKRVIWQS